jgi:hypothetical protein
VPKKLGTDEIERDIKDITTRFPFIQDTKIVLKTTHTIKIRLDITEECFIQIYRNIQKNITSYVAVLGHERIYGRDCDGGVWHRHPEKNPSGHDFSPEGVREVSLDEFLFETQEILLKKGIL